MKSTPVIMLAVLFGAESATNEIFIETPEGEQLLSGFAAHDAFLAYVEKFIVEKLKVSITSVLHFSKISFIELFSNIKTVDYILIQIVHALSNEDITLSNFLGKITMNLYEIEDNMEISDMLRNSIKLPVDQGFAMVKTLITADRKELMLIPEPILIEILMLVDVTAVISKASETGDVELVQWLLKFNIKFNSHLVLDEALAKESIGITKLLIENGALDDLSGREDLANLHLNKEGTLLHLASQSRRPRAIAALLQAGAEVDAIDSEGWSPLLRAVESKDLESVTLLVNHGANLNQSTAIGDFPLHLAVYNADLTMTKRLIKLGSKLDKKNRLGLTPLNVAENIVVSSVLRYIEDKTRERGSKISSILSEFLYEGLKEFLQSPNSRELLCQKYDISVMLTLSEIVNIFLRKGEVSRLTEELQMLLSMKARNVEDSDLSEILINLGYDTPDINIEPVLDDIAELNAQFLSLDENLKWRNETGHTYLHISAAEGDLRAVKMLLKKGADIEAKTGKNWTSLHFAANAGHFDVVSLLITNKAEVNARTSNQETPIHLASVNGHTEVVKILLVHGADVNSRTSQNCLTPLYLASRGGYIEVARELVNKNASVNVKDCGEYNLTPLQAAIFQRQLNVGKYLLEQGADIDARDRAGNTLLYTFAWNGDFEVVKTLLAWGADPGLRVGPRGLTALHVAAAQGKDKLVPILLSSGANIDAANIDGMTPLYMAVFNGHSQAMKALITGGANIYQSGPNGETILNFALRKGMVKLKSK